jgi:trk system potassium uptake protein TrkA
MKIVILGAGTLGTFLVSTFCRDNHDVVVIDKSSETIQRLKDKLDIMALTGNGANIANLKKTGIEAASMFIAASNNDTVNIHACTIAKHFGVKKTICRLTSQDYFNSDDNFAAQKLGIDHIVVPQDDCVENILNIVSRREVIEKITFNIPDATITAIKVLPASKLNGVKLCEFPEPELLHSIRFSAIIRKGRVLAPNGETTIMTGDELYVAGRNEDVETLFDWAYPQSRAVSSIVIAGGSSIGATLAHELSLKGYDVRLIDADFDNCEKILDKLNTKMLVIHGDSNEKDVLLEAGSDKCDLFIATQDDDENNILSCILAKRMGAEKVLTMTAKEEYIDIIPEMQMLDCGFSRRLVAANAILRSISTNAVHTDAVIHRGNAYVAEFEVNPKSTVANKKIDECKFPPSTVLSLIFRAGKVITPAGYLVLQPGDLVVVIATSATVKQIEALFKPKGIFAL